MPTDSTAEQMIDTCRDFDAAVEGYRRALQQYMTGDPTRVTAFFSPRLDVTLANPLGPPRRGPADVAEGIALGAAQLRDGSVRGFEEVSRYSTPDLGYVVQIERTQARLTGSADMSPIALRVTMIFRREGDGWKVAHRHADPITTSRSITTAIET
jgi:ketosteroid isomerase-like protein